jgi:hypothetical protein
MDLQVPVEIFAAAPAYSSGPPATDVSPPPAVELVTPTPAPAPSTQLPTIAIGGRRLSESVVDLINTLPATTASNNPPSKVSHEFYSIAMQISLNLDCNPVKERHL